MPFADSPCCYCGVTYRKVRAAQKVNRRIRCTNGPTHAWVIGRKAGR